MSSWQKQNIFVKVTVWFLTSKEKLFQHFLKLMSPYVVPITFYHDTDYLSTDATFTYESKILIRSYQNSSNKIKLVPSIFLVQTQVQIRSQGMP